MEQGHPSLKQEPTKSKPKTTVKEPEYLNESSASEEALGKQAHKIR